MSDDSGGDAQNAQNVKKLSGRDVTYLAPELGAYGAGQSAPPDPLAAGVQSTAAHGAVYHAAPLNARRCVIGHPHGDQGG